MKPKNAVTIALLLFVAASIVVLMVKSLRQSPQPQVASLQTAAAAPAPEMPSDGLVAYYFHSNTRCPTCQNIETYAHEAIETGFADALKDGRIRWRVLNYEKPENSDLARKYEIAMPMVVLVKMEDGTEKSWRSLDRVWELTGEKEEFVKYVQGETRDLLQGAGAS
jgi:hypothetical protein